MCPGNKTCPPQFLPDSKTPTLSRCSYPMPRESPPSWQKETDGPASPESIHTNDGRAANPPDPDPCRALWPCPREQRRLLPHASANTDAAILPEKFPRAFRSPGPVCAGVPAPHHERQREISDPGYGSGDWQSRCKAARCFPPSTAREPQGLQP